MDRYDKDGKPETHESVDLRVYTPLVKRSEYRVLPDDRVKVCPGAIPILKPKS